MPTPKGSNTEGRTDRPGKGLDVGTSNLVCAREETGGAAVTAIRNAFLDVQADPFTRNMLSRLKVQCIQRDDRLYIVGDTAFELANVFNRETRRPMQNGMLSPSEANALPIERLLIERLLGAPAVTGERCTFSIPADPVDSTMNVAYHSGVVSEILTKLGYSPWTIQEGHAVVLAELEPRDFTGIGISCGGGMFNICVAYRSVPVVNYSTSRGGDWVDQNAAAAVGAPASRLCGIKEKGVDIRAPKTNEEEAIAIYYRQLIEYTLNTLRLKFESTREIPSFPEPVDLVCSGGTSLAGGFIETFREQFQRAKFPIPVKEIRLAAEPLNTVAQGCLIAALSEIGSSEAPEARAAGR